MAQTRFDRAYLVVVITHCINEFTLNAALLAPTCCLLLVPGLLPYCCCWTGSPPTVWRPDALVASPRCQGFLQLLLISQKCEMWPALGGVVPMSWLHSLRGTTILKEHFDVVWSN